MKRCVVRRWSAAAPPAAAAVLGIVLFAFPVAWGERPPILDVEGDHDGVQVYALLELPVPAAVLRAVLTDYEGWPALFAHRLRLGRLERQPDRTVTELLIARTPWPGELRLVCETQMLPDGTVMTSGLPGADFRRYFRRWTLTPVPGGTRAEMEMRLALASWIPQWLLIEHTRADLLEHLRILRNRVLEEDTRKAP